MISEIQPSTIVFVINDLKGNGAERVVITLAKGLIGRGHSCYVLCFNETIEYDIEGLNVSFFPVKYWRWIPRLWRGRLLAPLLDRLIIQTCGRVPDLVLSNLLPCDRILSCSRLPNVHIVIHNVMSLERGRGFSEISVYNRKPAVCVSRGVQKDLLDLLPDRKNYSRVIHNPVDPFSIRLKAEDSIRLPELPFIVHVGKFKKEKRHDLLLQAFAKSSCEHDLVLVGQGPLESKLKELSHDLGIAHRVHFIGHHQNPFPIIKAADLLVLCSDYEGLGMVLLEALSLDIPALSTDCHSGPREILQAVQLVPVNDVAALAEALSVKDFSIYSHKLPGNYYLDYALNLYENLISFKDPKANA